MITLYRDSQAKERISTDSYSELTHLQQQIKQLQEYNKQTQQQEIAVLLRDIKEAMIRIQEKTDLSIQEQQTLIEAKKYINQFDQELQILHKDIKNTYSHPKKNKENPLDSNEYLVANASSFKSYLNELITKESTDNASIQLLGELFISTTDAMRMSAHAELSKGTRIEELSPDVRNTTASVISESLLALYGKLLSTSGGLTADYKIQQDALNKLPSSESVGSLEILYKEAVTKRILSKQQQDLLKTIIDTPALKTQREEQYKTTIKPTIDSQIGSFAQEYNQTSYTYKLSQRVTNKGSDILEGGKHLASKGLKGLEATGDRAIKHPVMAVVAGAGIYGVRNWLRGSSAKKSEEGHDTEKQKKADKRTRLGRMNETFNPRNRGLLGKAAVVGGVGYLALKAGNNLSPIWKEIQERRGKPWFGSGEPESKKPEEKPKKTEETEETEEPEGEQKPTPDQTTPKKEEKNPEKKDPKKEKKTPYEQLPDPNQARIKALAEKHNVPFVSKYEIIDQIENIQKRMGADEKLLNQEIQTILDTHHLVYFPAEKKFQPAPGYTWQYAKYILGGKPIPAEDQKLIDAVNVMTIEKKETEHKQNKSEKEQKNIETKEQVLTVIQESYPQTAEKLKGGVWDFGQKPRKESAFQSKLAEQIAKEQSPESTEQQGILTYVVAGEAKNFYYYYDRSTKKILIAENEHDLKEQIPLLQINKGLDNQKTPEQAAKNMEMIQAQLQSSETEYKIMMPEKLKDIDKKIEQAEKDGKSEEDIKKLKQESYDAISQQVAMHNTKMTYLEKAAVICMMRLPDAQIPIFMKRFPLVHKIVTFNGGVNELLTKKALKTGGKISLGLNLVNIVLDQNSSWLSKATVVGDTAAEMIPFAGGIYMIGKSLYGSGATGALTTSERLRAAGAGVLSLGLDVAGLFSFGAGNAGSAALKAGAKTTAKVASALTKVGKGVVWGTSAYLGMQLATQTTTIVMSGGERAWDKTKKNIYGEQKHNNHKNDAINK